MTLRAALGSWFAPLLIHNQNQSEALQRALAAQGQGLDPATYGTPFPGGNVTNTTTTNQSARGWLPGALLGAALLAGGGAAVLGLANYLTPAAVTTAPNAPANAPKAGDPKTTPTQPTTGPGWDAIYEQFDPATGQWKQIKREPLLRPAATAGPSPGGTTGAATAPANPTPPGDSNERK